MNRLGSLGLWHNATPATALSHPASVCSGLVQKQYGSAHFLSRVCSRRHDPRQILTRHDVKNLEWEKQKHIMQHLRYLTCRAENHTCPCPHKWMLHFSLGPVAFETEGSQATTGSVAWGPIPTLQLRRSYAQVARRSSSTSSLQAL